MTEIINLGSKENVSKMVDSDYIKMLLEFGTMYGENANVFYKTIMRANSNDLVLFTSVCLSDAVIKINSISRVEKDPKSVCVEYESTKLARDMGLNFEKSQLVPRVLNNARTNTVERYVTIDVLFQEEQEG